MMNDEIIFNKHQQPNRDTYQHATLTQDQEQTKTEGLNIQYDKGLNEGQVQVIK